MVFVRSLFIITANAHSFVKRTEFDFMRFVLNFAVDFFLLLTGKIFKTFCFFIAINSLIR